ncbi:MAG: hypothetical protein ABFD90_04440 [Phycisphaerales bacterium]
MTNAFVRQLSGEDPDRFGRAADSQLLTRGALFDRTGIRLQNGDEVLFCGSLGNAG